MKYLVRYRIFAGEYIVFHKNGDPTIMSQCEFYDYIKTLKTPNDQT